MVSLKPVCLFFFHVQNESIIVSTSTACWKDFKSFILSLVSEDTGDTEMKSHGSFLRDRSLILAASQSVLELCLSGSDLSEKND